jgi:hypothetical protein
MEPRIYPPWEPRPLQELDAGLRQAVEAVRDQPVPPDALGRALERAAEAPDQARPPRRWFRPRVVVAALTVAASLLIALGLWTALSGTPGGSAERKRGRGDAMQSDTVRGLSYEERERLMANGPGTPIDIDVGGVDGKGPRSPHPLLRGAAPAEATYDHVRRLLLEEKRLPSPRSVRIEELINAFPCAYAGPRGEHPVAFTLNLVECPWERSHHLVRIGLKGRSGDVEAIARDVKLRVEFNPRRVAAYRLLGEEAGPARPDDFADDRQPGASLRPGHTATALYEVIPAGLPVPAEGEALRYQRPAAASGTPDGGEWLRVQFRYRVPDTDTRQVVAQLLTGSAHRLADAPEDCRLAAAVASFGLLLGRSAPGDLTWADVRALARAAGPAPAGLRAEFLEMVDAAASLAGAANSSRRGSY